MNAREARRLIGQVVIVRKRYSGLAERGTMVDVKGRNVEIRYLDGMTDWLWLPDVVIRPDAADMADTFRPGDIWRHNNGMGNLAVIEAAVPAQSTPRGTH